ncbi:putative exonuclease SbcCD, C subunit [compost metagenome]
MEAVNHSLRSAQYNPGSYLRIEVEDRIPEDARRFQEDLTKALAQTAGVGNPASAEERFAALKAIIQRLGSQSDADLAWRERVLDVRLHVEFVARELEVGTDREIEVYRSGGGKSGGQRQKLTATCLAAALRYQLGGPERIRSSFATVILDEAFDKADADFTEAAIRVFKMFGFQLIIATPVKSVMTIEPFVGGAVYIHIQGGKQSNLMQLPYDEVGQRIDLDAAGVETSSDGTI